MSNFSSKYILAFEKAANDVLESPDLLEEIRALAKHMAKAFSGGKSKTQVSHLEVLGFSTRRFHDITAYVQRQTGKENKANQGWLTPEDAKERRTLGEKTLAFIENIGKKADGAWDALPEQVKAESEGVEGEQKNALRLKIASVALRHLHSAYLYEPIREGRKT